MKCPIELDKFAMKYPIESDVVQQLLYVCKEPICKR